MNDTVAYRPEIDGLRALAVIPVILFHAGVSPFSGGFVGVDVFFVISGFLITQILKRDIEAGEFSILSFYERRIRRIIPALLLTLFLTIIGAWWVTTATEFRATAMSALSSLGFVSNIYFWRGSGYFDQGALRPLLHTWSLSVEEQFYIIFPIALLILLRWRRLLFPIIIGTFFISLLIATIGVFRAPSVTFFLIPTRAWELLMGAMLALGMVPAIRRQRAAELVGATGLALIIGPVFLYNSSTYFPGLAAVPPCLGAAMVIHSCRERTTVASRMLSWRPAVFVGLLSYSLYLIHYPLFAYSKRILPDGINAAQTLALIALTFAMSYLSWRFVEKPFRSRSLFARRRLFRTTALGTFATAALAVVIFVSGGVPQRFTDQERLILSAMDGFDPAGSSCLSQEIDVAESMPGCRFGFKPVPRAARPQYMVMGDSHAAAIAAAFERAMPNQGKTAVLYAFNSCAPLIGLGAPALSYFDQLRCIERNAALVEMAQDRETKGVYLTAYWAAHLRDVKSKHLDGERRFALALDRTLKALAGKDITILLDVPQSKRPVALMSVFAPRFGQSPPVVRSGAYDQASAIIRRVAKGRATIVDLSAPFCPRPERCSAFYNGVPILTDNNHLTRVVASEVIANVLNGDSTATQEQRLSRSHF